MTRDERDTGRRFGDVCTVDVDRYDDGYRRWLSDAIGRITAEGTLHGAASELPSLVTGLDDHARTHPRHDVAPLWTTLRTSPC